MPESQELVLKLSHMAEQPAVSHEDVTEDIAPSDKFSALKIALQVFGHDTARLLLPAVVILLVVACGAGLFVWSVLELQKIPAAPLPRVIDSIPIEMPKSRPVPQMHAPVSRPTASKNWKAIKHARRHTSQKLRRANAYSYQRNWWDPDNPTGGRVIRADGYTTEYSWNK